MEKRINMGGEFYMADFGYFSMSVYKGKENTVNIHGTFGNRDHSQGL